MTTIRKAEPADIPELVDFLALLFAIEADFAFDREKQAQGLQLLLNDVRACVLVAAGREQLQGMCTIQTLISTAEGGPVGIVEDLVVAAGSRGRGIGTMLLQGAVDWAGQQGLKRLQLLADKNNSPALDFYRKQRWQSTQLICLKKLL